MIDRVGLDKIIRTDGGDNWWKPELFVKNTRNLLPKELEVISNPPAEDKNFNCFIYAFGLSDDTEIIKDCGGFLYDTFFLKMLELGELKHTANAQDGSYITYEDRANYPSMITHIGIKEGDKIISKWSWGPLIRHNKLDVPASYGNDISYLEPLEKERAKMLYWKYKEFNIKPPED